MYCTDTNMVVCMLIIMTLGIQEMWHKAVCTMLSYCDILDYTTLPASGTLHHYMFTHTHNGLADGDSPHFDSSNLGLLLSGLLSEHHPVYHQHKHHSAPHPV